jgi:hypothetical protein
MALSSSPLVVVVVVSVATNAQNATNRSSIVAVAWHPNSQFLATACTDKKCRVWCAHFENHDGPLALGEMADFLIEGSAEEVDFGTPIAEFGSQVGREVTRKLRITRCVVRCAAL